MELKQLRSFVMLARTLHFGLAAERLRITQPQVSRRIKQLEEELEAELFERDTKNVRLSPAGEAFLPEALKLLKLEEQARQRLTAAAQGKTGRITIGLVNAALYGPLPTALGLYREAFPDVVLRFIDNISPSELLLRALEEGDIDVAFAHPPVRLTADLERITIVKEPLVAALPAGHPLAGRRRIALAALADEAWVMFPRETNDKGVYDRIIALCHRAGFSPRITQEGSHTLTRLSLVAGGFGVHLVHRSWETMPFPGVAYVPIEPTDDVMVCCYWRRSDTTPLLGSFIETMRRFDVSPSGGSRPPASRAAGE